MLRSPRAREMAVKYLDSKIPKDLKEFLLLNKVQPDKGNVKPSAHRKQKIFPSKYNVKIEKGKISVIDIADYFELPEWLEYE